MRRLLCLSLLLPLAAADDKPVEDPRRMQPDHAPTPYTADEIREACGEGRKDTYRIESGTEVKTRVATFVKCDAEGADMEATDTKADGTSTTTKGHGTWKQFQSHASFPEGATKITEETIEVPAGKFDCWLYTVARKQGDKAITTRMYFAKKLPGPPVKLVAEVDGKVATSMTLIEHKDPPAKKEEEAPSGG
jgi:hypothetical protein